MILLGFFIFLTQLSFAQSFGSAKIETAQSVVASPAGFAFLGNAQQDGENFDLWTIFTDTSFQFLSEKKYGGLSKDIGAKIKSTPGGFFVLGTTFSSELPSYKGDGDFFVTKTDKNGNISWQKCLGGSRLDQAASLVSTGDGGAVIVGETFSADSPISYTYGQGDWLAQKIDSEGNLEWTKTYGGSKTDYPKDITATPDGGFIIIGTTFSHDGSVVANLGHSDMWVIKIDHGGNLEWSKTYGGATFDYGQAICPVKGGGYVLVGSIGLSDLTSPDILDRFNQDLLAIKITEAGDVVWQKNYGFPRYDAGLAVYPMLIDDGFLITGYMETELSGNPHTAYKNAWTLKLDADGNKAWETTSTGSTNEYGVAIGVRKNNGIIAVIGDTDAPDGEWVTHGRKDIWVTKYHDLETLSVSLGNDFGVCAGKRVVLDATVADCSDCTYLWENQSTQPIREFFPTESGSYKVTVTKPSGATSSDEITITVFDLPTTTIDKTNPNAGQANGHIKVTPAGGQSPYQILWDQGLTDFELNNLPADTFHFVMTDFNGCTVEDTIMLKEVVANQDAFSATSVKIFPNPSSSFIHIQSSEDIKAMVIIGADGRIYPIDNPQNMDIAIGHLAPGNYVLKIQLKTGVVTNALVIL